MASKDKNEIINNKGNENELDSRPTVFYDQGCGVSFIFSSTVNTNDTVIINGIKYPLYKIETSCYSHSAYIGDGSVTIQTSAIKKFLEKYNRKKK